MNRINTWSAGQSVASADLNEIQDQAVGLITSATNNHLSSMAAGLMGIEWQYASDLATATEVKIESAAAVASWIDRIVIVLFRSYSNGNWQPGGADDYGYDGTTLYLQKGYTGGGARNAANTNPPSNGDPPVPASNVSWAVLLTTNVWLYAKASDGALYLYNDTGSTLFKPNLTVLATSDTTKR